MTGTLKNSTSRSALTLVPTEVPLRLFKNILVGTEWDLTKKILRWNSEWIKKRNLFHFEPISETCVFSFIQQCSKASTDLNLGRERCIEKWGTLSGEFMQKILWAPFREMKWISEWPLIWDWWLTKLFEAEKLSWKVKK